MDREFGIGARGAQTRMADRLNKSQNYISRCLADAEKAGSKNIGEDFARSIELEFDLPIYAMDTLAAIDGQANAASPKANVRSDVSAILEMAPWDSGTPLDDDEVELPLYKEVELAAGGGRTAVHEIKGRKLRFSYATLRAAGVDPAAAICAQITGNSMEPMIFDGSTIGIDTATKNILDGEIYALEHDGMLRVKLLYRLPGGGLRVRSYNRDEYPDEEYSAEDIEHLNIRVIGWVFWWSTVRHKRSLHLAR
jgi:phage repressor protein C with HTH and peptisase S24 domain